MMNTTTARQQGSILWTGRFSVKCLWCKKRFICTEGTANSAAKQAHKLTCEPFKNRKFNELRNFTQDEIVGQVNESIPCGAKCVTAKGPNCDCSCGGENHGRN